MVKEVDGVRGDRKGDGRRWKVRKEKERENMVEEVEDVGGSKEERRRNYG